MPGPAGTPSPSPIRKDFVRYVELANKGARQLGFKDNGAMWRSKYDMAPDDFAKELDRLWEQVKPLYLSLHAYVRNRLREKYGDAVPATGAIPGQPAGEHVGAGLGQHLPAGRARQCRPRLRPHRAPQEAQHGLEADGQVRRGLLHVARIRAAARNVLGALAVPQAAAIATWCATPAPGMSIRVDDLRLKMCIQITGEDFLTVHHELGHNFYQRAYNKQPPCFRDSANDGFHEAVGDTIALSITPEYLVKIGLLDQAPDTSKDIGLLLHKALEKIAFLPFGLVIDQWRWKVFSGEIPPEKYNETWWQLRQKYQGIAPPVDRSESRFRSRPQNITWPPTFPTCATSWPTFCSSSFTARCRRPPAAPGR